MSKVVAIAVPMVIGASIVLYVTVFYKYVNSCWKSKCLRRGENLSEHCKKHFK